MTEQAQPQRMRIGEGKISGALSVFLAVISLGAVICFHFPEHFTTSEFRAVYPVEVLRWVLLACLVLAFGFALTSFLLSGKNRLGFAGVVISAFAIVLGGNTVEIQEFDQSIASISLDWLLIDILVLSAIFIPLELFLPKRAEQTKFHLEWKADLMYFAFAHLFVQFTAVAVKAPAESVFGGWGLTGIQSTVSSWPFLVQLFLAMLIADIFQYAAHRTFHTNRFLWRFHAVHHSIRAIDWLAGSRLHLVDIVVTRAFSYIPLYLLGFSMPVFYAYVAIVSLQAVAAHANVRIRFGPLKYLLVTPQYHHWHHCDDPDLYDKNFAIHFPLIDRCFGTYHLPGDEWPETMGLGEEKYPKGYLRQLVYPFWKDPKTAEVVDPSGR
ncbi:MAG: sterol desaturase family protein [Planctomycetota bacterium]|nr:sterol desaturase family protein [Planctomycetota bacterium]